MDKNELLEFVSTSVRFLVNKAKLSKTYKFHRFLFRSGGGSRIYFPCRRSQSPQTNSDIESYPFDCHEKKWFQINLLKVADTKTTPNFVIFIIEIHIIKVAKIMKPHHHFIA